MLKFCLCKYFLPLPQRNNLALAHDPIEKPAPGQQSTSSKHATLISSDPEPAIWSCDTSQWMPCYDSCNMDLFLLPLPLPLPLAHFFYFMLTPTANFSSSQSSTVTKSKMASDTKIYTRALKICLHCKHGIVERNYIIYLYCVVNL